MGTDFKLSDNKKFALALIFILLAQLLILPRTAPLFFDGDAFFYFAHHIDTWQSFKDSLLAPDKARQYRPLGQILFSYVFYPVFRLDYLLYHVTALFFHMLNTVLIFFVFKRLLKSPIAVIAATIFWGLHPVAIYVTHSFSFLADFTFVFFYLLAIILYFKYIDTGKISFGICVLISFIASMACKETAVTLPAVLAFLTISFLSEDVDSKEIKTRSKWLLFVMFAGLGVFLVGYFWMKGGRLYDAAGTQNYYLNFSISALLNKLDYLLAGMFMPFPENQNRPGAVIGANRLALFAFPFIVILLFYMFWPGRSINRKIWLGFFLYFLLLIPVLFITPQEFTHNIYLPVAGLAIATAVFIEDFAKVIKESGWTRPEFFYLYALTIVFCSLIVNQEIFTKINWRTNYEKIARSSIEGLQKLHPRLPIGSVLYIIRSPVPAYPWIIYDGLFFKIFRKDPTLSVRFQEWNEPFPVEEVKQGKGFVLAYTEGRFYDMTKEYMDQFTTPNAISLLDKFKEATVSAPFTLLESENLGTPENKVAFVATVVRNNEARIAMVSLASARVRYALPVLGKDSRLLLGTAMQFDMGDGAEGRIYFQTGEETKLIYSRYINPKQNAGDRVWFDDTVSLSEFAGKAGYLVFECNPGYTGDATADWFMWSRMRLEGLPPQQQQRQIATK